MTIEQVKQEILDAIRAYFSKNEFGEPVIPPEKQRPLFLVGPPGVGKSAVVRQAAQELGIGLVCTSLAHHSAQSALGLPVAAEKSFGGVKVSVSDYAMSEILAPVYELMEETGLREGILFLDELNRASDALSSVLLHFLQYKSLGRYSLPSGWVVVTAGNPPAAGGARELEAALGDRVKRIEAEPDYAAWRRYARQSGIHPAIPPYLDARPGEFYQLKTTVGGRSYVTARGWSDLSAMLRLYEQSGARGGEELMRQYLQNRNVARGFAAYYARFSAWRESYCLEEILSGESERELWKRASEAGEEERAALLSLLLDASAALAGEVCLAELAQDRLQESLKEMRADMTAPGADARAVFNRCIADSRAELSAGRRSSSLTEDAQYALNAAVAVLEEERTFQKDYTGGEAWRKLKMSLDRRGKALRRQGTEAARRLNNLLLFAQDAFGRESRELESLVAGLEADSHGARFLSRYTCEEYAAYRQKDVSGAAEPAQALPDAEGGED